jgi:trehalose 6-phosphate phosphatase
MPIVLDVPGLLRDAWQRSSLSTLGLMLDYDGTLAPIVSNPANAIITQAHQQLLVQLTQHPAIRVAIVSGRTVEQLQGFLPQLVKQPVILCGVHGGHITVPVGDSRKTAVTVSHKQHRQALAQFKVVLLNLLNEQALSGYTLEDKQTTLALHYKNMPLIDKQRAIAVFMACFQANRFSLLHGWYTVQDGKDVLEVLPKGSNKGQAVQWIMEYWQQQEQQRLFPFYAGDDLTDESAFDVLNKPPYQGMTCCVGKLDTLANYVLPDVDHVYAELAFLLG